MAQNNQLVFAENSPYDSMEVLIEQDDLVAYMYLRRIGAEHEGNMKSCWIRNLGDAPAEIDRERLAQGLPPQLPAALCAETAVTERLDEKKLRIVWLASGDGVALLEDNDVLAYIPPSTGVSDYDGFARDCLGPSPFCAPLGLVSDSAKDRLIESDKFWQSWSNPSTPWDQYEPTLLKTYESRFGSMTSYVSIDDGKWPPRTLARFQSEDRTILLTVGVAICPQPKVDEAFEDPSRWRRIEWGAAFDRNVSPDLVETFTRYLSGQSNLPWQQQVFLADGHSISCDLFLSSSLLPDFSSILLCSQKRLNHSSQLDMPEFKGDSVDLLWCLPVFESERRFIQETSNFGIIDEILEQHPVPTIGHRPTSI